MQLSRRRRRRAAVELGLPARALTALGIRADAHGTRRGVLAEVVPEGAALTELASIVARAGASAQSMHHDTQGHYGDAAMTTAFVVLQDTPAELGALRVVRGSHATQSREGSACGDGSEHAATVLSATAGSAVLMDSRTFHGGGANTLSCLPPAAADGSGTTTTTTVTETAPTTATTATAAAPFSSSSTTTTQQNVPSGSYNPYSFGSPEARSEEWRRAEEATGRARRDEERLSLIHI